MGIKIFYLFSEVRWSPLDFHIIRPESHASSIVVYFPANLKFETCPFFSSLPLLGTINSFLSWCVFAILARLTFMVYLLHLDFIYMFFYSLTYTVEISHLIVAILNFNYFKTFSSIHVVCDFFSLLDLLLCWTHPHNFRNCFCGYVDCRGTFYQSGEAFPWK